MKRNRSKVLVVDDQPINREIIRELLNAREVDVVMASNGVEAIECYRQQVFDCILMDMQMPLMSGDEATRRIREHEQMTGHHVRIVALTAQSYALDYESCLQAGMDAYLIKPVMPDALFRALDLENTNAYSGHQLQQDNIAEQKFSQKHFQTHGLLSKKTAALFVKSFPQLLEDIDQALFNEDYPRLAKSAHRLAGTAAMLGAETLASCAAELELYATSGGTKQHLIDLCEHLKNMAFSYAAALQVFINNPDG